MTGDLGQAALEYAARGWLVIPLNSPTARGCSCRQADCAKPGKHPRTAHGLKDASCDPAIIHEWWTRWPDANIGIVTGPESGILVLDVDGRQGEESLIELARRGWRLPDTFTVRTGGGGQHNYFRWPNGANVRNSQSRIAPGLDIRGQGGYVVAPPSRHASGSRYGINETAIPPAPPPEWLLSPVQAPQGAQARQSATAAGPVIEHPNRTPHLTSLAGTMNKRGMDPTAIEAALLAENAAKCSPPLPPGKVQAIARDIPARYPNLTEQLVPHGGGMNGYTLIPLGDLMAQPDIPTEYLLEGRLVAGTVSVIVAKPKVGKSTLARNLALAVSTGSPFLGSDTLQGEVIYLALEERPEEIKADFLAMSATGEEPIQIHAAAAPEAAMPELVELVKSRKPRLVVIDPLFRLARIRDEKAYAETYQALGALIDVARETGTHILLTHHSGKGLKSDAIDAPLGSTALGGIPATILVLKRTEGYRTLQTVQRIGVELPETVLSFNSDTRTLSLGTSKVEVEQGDAEARILEFLAEAAEPRTQEQIREGVEGQTKVIRAALTALTNASQVRRTGEGKRGKPFFYESWFSGSEYMQETREPETESAAQTAMNTGAILVPKSDGRSMPVPGTAEDYLETFDSSCGGLLQ